MNISLILRMTIHSMHTRSGHIKRRAVFFSLAFEKIAVAVDEILSRDQEAMYCDCGNIDFIVTYEDGNRMVREFGVPADEFADCFKIIREIIPVTEDVPEAIRISEDCEDE